ncbi:DUF4282 domain-containing protein [uncultured Corynebacterium sp.]|uniref:DUF4282 domain-containing protein n=1 Tax=uncultured Corynebacterium sp. TaxID=159447 RepID=UPI00262E7B0C|nr:DUF4282 domain-containing protein [uncultured Corynebacterium sp.]
MGNESFLSGLFDINFEKYTTRSFLRVLYILATIVIGLYLLFSLIGTWTNSSFLEFYAYASSGQDGAYVKFNLSGGDSVGAKLISSVVSIFQSIVNLAIVRVVLEVFAALTSTSAAWARIKQRGMSA